MLLFPWLYFGMKNDTISVRWLILLGYIIFYISSWDELLVASAFSSSSSSSFFYKIPFHTYDCHVSCCRRPLPYCPTEHVLYSQKRETQSSSQDNDDESNYQNDDLNRNKNKKQANKNNNNNNSNSKKKKKKKKKSPPRNSNILEILDPYKAGMKLRETLDSALTNLNAATSSSPVKALPSERRAIYYYLDDRISDDNINRGSNNNNNNEASLVFAERNPLLDSYYRDDEYIPEVLVVGATGEVGRLVVRRLLIDGRFRVRVLVRDLYSHTLNMLGTGVTYCQGDLNNMDSLEYALTDVDKIVFCAGPPKPDETDYSTKLEQYATETLDTTNNNDDDDDLYWDQIESIRKIRAQLAEQVDCLGMKNLVCAYQNVRHADYGTSQAAKRSLFKFQSRPGDFNLFFVDEEIDNDNTTGDDKDFPPNDNSNTSANTTTKSPITDQYSTQSSNYDDDSYSNDYEKYNGNNYDNYDNYDSTYTSSSGSSINDDNYYEQMNEMYGDYYNNNNVDNSSPELESEKGKGSTNNNTNNDKRKRNSRMKSGQVSWIKNKFGHGVFVGRVPITDAGSNNNNEASIVSSRLRSRDDPDTGIDLSNGFAGFVMRVCADGKNYECFIRTQEYNDNNKQVEYVCPFSTIRKATNNSNSNNKSFNKFTTIRLPFSKFQPRSRNSDNKTNNNRVSGSSFFDGKDIRQIGFRIRGKDNPDQSSRSKFRFRRQTSYNNPQQRKKSYNLNKYVKFYLAISYIKVYRSQPEPEFIYLSDSRLPPKLNKEMIRHDLRQILLLPTTTDDNNPHQQSNNKALNDGSDPEATTIFDEKAVEQVSKNPKDRSGEEVYFKYRGEEILRHSGLSYSIIRIAGYNELPSGDSSSVYLQQSDEDVIPVSRADVAEVCVSALLDPNASNVCFYMTKKTGLKQFKFDDDLSEKFAGLEPETF